MEEQEVVMCNVEINLHANKEALDWFAELVTDFTAREYIDHFCSTGVDENNAQWIQKYDWVRKGEGVQLVCFEAIEIPPSILIQNFVKQLQTQDTAAYCEGRYWREDYSTVGIFRSRTPEEWQTAETSVTVDPGAEYNWEHRVEPAINSLELN